MLASSRVVDQPLCCVQICDCFGMYSGSTCENDPCYGFDCNSHGSCRISGVEAYCDCDSDYSGAVVRGFVLCLVQCFHRPMMLQSIAGTRCEFDSCYGFTCNGHGKCSVRQSDLGLMYAACTCDGDYHGRHCESEPCADILCLRRTCSWLDLATFS